MVELRFPELGGEQTCECGAQQKECRRLRRLVEIEIYVVEPGAATASLRQIDGERHRYAIRLLGQDEVQCLNAITRNVDQARRKGDTAGAGASRRREAVAGCTDAENRSDSTVPPVPWTTPVKTNDTL